MSKRTYVTPYAFKQALEKRLRDSVATGAELGRRRQLLVFDRFLARVVAVLGDAVTLKGGLVLELRLRRARTTKDVDLRLTGSTDRILERLQEAGRRALGDFMSFEVQPDAHHPGIDSEGMKYEGLRFRAECKLSGKLYGRRFGVDVAFGDPILGEPERIVAEDLLAFVGVAPPAIRIYPVESHVAEKLHAYTLPRSRPNTRVKDLPDFALLATAKSIDAHRLRAALEQTFAFRGTHDLPAALPEPPLSWTQPYAAMAAQDGLQWLTLPEVFAASQAFLDPVLTVGLDATWDPEDWNWRSKPES
ncbi:MAG: nucleotidyl transferase AbiEii/AbiGii toxin family protein [Planctomycetes bacterium]|nr:nucleotidyl transferase AbiEii/AbiGii toxin family protein [Planctomycetota bacterium]